jgi:hypothetical protein
MKTYRVYAVRESYEYWEGDALNEEDARKKADDEYEQGAWKETNTLDWRIVDVEYVGED